MPDVPRATNTLHWGLADPSDADQADQPEAFRRTVAELATRMKPFVEMATRPADAASPGRRAPWALPSS